MARDAMRQTVLTVGSIIWLVLGAVSQIGIYNRLQFDFGRAASEPDLF